MVHAGKVWSTNGPGEEPANQGQGEGASTDQEYSQWTRRKYEDRCRTRMVQAEDIWTKGETRRGA